MSWKPLTIFSKMDELDYPTWLDEDGRRVYAATLSKVKEPTPERLEMLAAYADAIVNLRRVRNDPERAALWRGVVLYARNGLGFGDRVFVDLLELIIDSGRVNEPVAVFCLKPEWQLPEAERPEDH